MLKISVVLLLVVVACAIDESLLPDFEPLDDDNIEVLEAADKSADFCDSKINGEYRYKLVRIIAAKKEEVAGFKAFKLDLTMGRTTCKKQEVTFEEAKKCYVDIELVYIKGVLQSEYKKCTVLVTFDREGIRQSISVHLKDTKFFEN